jgi:hypothetical protein
MRRYLFVHRAIMNPYMKQKTKAAQLLEKILQHKKLVVGGITASILFTIAALMWLPLPWQFAFKNSVPVVPIKIAIKDNKAHWYAEYEGDVHGAGTHWLGQKSVSYPKNRDGGLWYDGKLVARERPDGKYMDDYQLSFNGEHYGYRIDTHSTDINEPIQSKIVVDGKDIAQGYGLSLSRITDTGDVYYTCAKCGENTNGFYKNDKKIASQTLDNKWGDPNTDCLFQHGVDTQRLLNELTKPLKDDTVIGGCSPNGKHFVTHKIEAVWPESSKDVLFMNNTRIDEGNITNLTVNDDGKLTYLKAGPLPNLDSLTINGRGNYILSNVEDPLYGMLYSPSRKNIAVIQQGSWWVNGRPTGIDQNANVSLSDNAFYVYQF